MASGGGNLGSAFFTMTADTTGFVASLNKAEVAARATSSKIGTELNRASTEGARGLLQLSYAVDDLQYGFRAIVNNIPQMALALGGSAGLSAGTSMSIAAGAGVAAVAISQLINHWGYLTDLAQSSWAGSSIEQLTALRTKAEEAATAFEHLAKVPTSGQAAEGKAVRDDITEIGATNLAGNLAQRIGMDPGLRTEMTKDQKLGMTMAGEEERMGNKAGAARMRAKIQKELDQANFTKAKELIVQASEAGPGGDQARLQLRRLNPDIADNVAQLQKMLPRTPRLHRCLLVIAAAIMRWKRPERKRRMISKSKFFSRKKLTTRIEPKHTGKTCNRSRINEQQS